MLERSAPVTPQSDMPKLIPGQMAYQIFSTEKYIFKLTSTKDTLYRVSFHRESDRGGNDSFVVDKDSRCIFRRVKFGENGLDLLRMCKKNKVRGFPTEFAYDRHTYKIFEVLDQLNRRRGYMLVRRDLDPNNEANQLYYIFQRSR